MNADTEACGCPECVAERLPNPAEQVAAPVGPTMVIAVSEMIDLHRKLADAVIQRDRIARALQNLWIYPTEHQGHTIPVMSEAFLYDALGKDDARAFSYKVEQIAQAIGLDWWEEVEKPANVRFNSAVTHDWHLRFPSEAEASAFSSDFRGVLPKLLGPNELVPAVSYPVMKVDIDPPEVEKREGKPDKVVSSKYQKVLGERNLTNVLIRPNAWIVEYLRDHPDVVVVSCRSSIDHSNLYPE